MNPTVGVLCDFYQVVDRQWRVSHLKWGFSTAQTSNVPKELIFCLPI